MCDRHKTPDTICWGCLELQNERAAEMLRKNGAIPEAQESFRRAAQEARTLRSEIEAHQNAQT